RYGSLERALGGQDRLIAQGYGFTQAQRDAGGILRAIIIGQRKREDEARAKSYRSPHFDQPNVLAHVRFNERTDVDGKRVLFIEEIQSDWHQAGRKRGYKDGSERRDYRIEPHGDRFVVVFDNGSRIGTYPTAEAAEAAAGE